MGTVTVEAGQRARRRMAPLAQPTPAAGVTRVRRRRAQACHVAPGPRAVARA